MGQIIENVLLAHMEELCSRLNCGAELLNRFFSQTPPLFSITEKQEILACETQYARNDAFLTQLMTKDDRALDVLHGYLQRSGHGDLAAKLEKSAKDAGYIFSNSSDSSSHQVEPDADADFPIARQKLVDIRKYLEESMEIYESWLLIKDDLVIKAKDRSEIKMQYNLKDASPKGAAIAITLDKWHARGKTVATFENLVKIIREYDEGVADQILADREKIRAVNVKAKGK